MPPSSPSPAARLLLQDAVEFTKIYDISAYKAISIVGHHFADDSTVREAKAFYRATKRADALQKVSQFVLLSWPRAMRGSPEGDQS